MTATANSGGPWRERPEAERERQASVPHIPSGFEDFTFFPDKTLDHLMQTVISLGAEQWVMRRRLMALQAALAAAGRPGSLDVERFAPGAELDRQWIQERDAFIRRVFDPLKANAGIEPSPMSEGASHER